MALHPRLQAILDLVPPGDHPIAVDVGCDHGQIARALGAIGAERRANRLPRARPDQAPIPMVVADGLRPFRRVDLAVVTGMGPSKIAAILAAGPRPSVAIVHSPQHAHALRAALARAGWRIDAERLAPEGRGFAEVMRIVPGVERAEGYALRFGPRLLEGDDPLLPAHVRQARAYWERLARDLPPGTAKRRDAAGWARFLSALPD